MWQFWPFFKNGQLFSFIQAPCVCSSASYTTSELVTAKMLSFYLISSFFFHMKHSISQQWLKIISAVQFPLENKQAPLKWCSINCSFFSCSLCCSVSCLSHCNLMCSSADSNSRFIFSWSMTFISCSSVCSCNLRSDSRRPTI